MPDSPSLEHASAAEELAQTFARTWNARDGEGYGEAYWPDAELVDPTGQIWDGRDAIAEMHVQLWQGPAKSSSVQARVRRIRPVDTNVMVIDLEIDVQGFAVPPGAPTQDHGRMTARLKHVVQKRGSEWRIVASQNTFVATAPAGGR